MDFFHGSSGWKMEVKVSLDLAILLRTTLFTCYAYLSLDLEGDQPNTAHNSIVWGKTSKVRCIHVICIENTRFACDFSNGCSRPRHA